MSDDDAQPDEEKEEQEPWLSDEQREQIDEWAAEARQSATEFADSAVAFIQRAWARSRDRADRALSAYWAWSQTTRAQTIYLIMATCVFIGVFAAAAAVVDGGLAAAGFVAGVVVSGFIPVMVNHVLKDSTPASGAVGMVMAMLAQLTYVESALVRSETGEYEWHAIREQDGQRYAVLDSGKHININGKSGELYHWQFGKLAITEDKNTDKMASYQAEQNEGVMSGGFLINPGEPKTDHSWLISLKKVQNRIAKAGSPDIIRKGREKALMEQGGEQQISELVVMAGAGVLAVVGFVLAAGTLFLTG